MNKLNDGAADNRDAAGVERLVELIHADMAGGYTNGKLRQSLAKHLPPDTPTAAPAGEAVAFGWVRPSELEKVRRGEAGMRIGVHVSPVRDEDCTAPIYTHPPAAEAREVDAVRALDNIEEIIAHRVPADIFGALSVEIGDLRAALSPPGRAEGES